MKHTSFSQVFHTLLVGVGVVPLGSCEVYDSTSGCSGGGTFESSRTEERMIEVRHLEDVLADGRLFDWECIELCSLTLGQTISCELSYDEELFEQLRTAESPDQVAGGTGGQSSNFGGSAGQSLGGSMNGDGGNRPPGPSIPIQCTSTERSQRPVCRGRQHETWTTRDVVRADDAIGRWLARTGADEAASVHSFRALSAELRDHAIAPSLRRRRRTAARDEIRHARAMDRFAKARGARRPTQRFAAPVRRPLVDIAVENAREGCVAETYAGLLTLHQAHTAVDSELRAALETIADDECGHAELAWDLHAAFLALLTQDERARVQATLRAEIDGLGAVGNEHEGSFGDVPRTARRALGLPEPSLEVRYRRALARVLRARAEAATNDTPQS